MPGSRRGRLARRGGAERVALVAQPCSVHLDLLAPPEGGAGGGDGLEHRREHDGARPDGEPAERHTSSRRIGGSRRQRSRDEALDLVGAERRGGRHPAVGGEQQRGWRHGHAERAEDEDHRPAALQQPVERAHRSVGGGQREPLGGRAHPLEPPSPDRGPEPADRKTDGDEGEGPDRSAADQHDQGEHAEEGVAGHARPAHRPVGEGSEAVAARPAAIGEVPPDGDAERGEEAKGKRCAGRRGRWDQQGRRRPARPGARGSPEAAPSRPGSRTPRWSARRRLDHAALPPPTSRTSRPAGLPTPVSLRERTWRAGARAAT